MDFAGLVADQYVNQAPMSSTPSLTPRLEGYEAALRIYGYNEADWLPLVDWACFLHRLRYKLDPPNDLVRRLTKSDERPMGLSLAELSRQDVIDHGPYA